MKVVKDYQVSWNHFKYADWQLYIATTQNGLCYVGSQNAPKEELNNWVNKRLPNYELVEDIEKLKKYEAELMAYLDGENTTFTIPTDLNGTTFQKQVWQELELVPYGETVSYSEIAQRLGKAEAVRAVATAIGANPLLIIIPCHRVIAKSGKLTGYRGGLNMKEQLLELEK